MKSIRIVGAVTGCGAGLKRGAFGLLAVGCALWGSGCVQLPEKRVSPGSEAGVRYVLKSELRACGIKREARDLDPAYVLLVGNPGIAGRFVVQLGTVPAGTEFEVVGAVRSGIGPTGGTRLVVRFVQRTAWGGTEARIADQATWRFYSPAAESAELRLNPEFFRRVE